MDNREPKKSIDAKKTVFIVLMAVVAIVTVLAFVRLKDFRDNIQAEAEQEEVPSIFFTKKTDGVKLTLAPEKTGKTEKTKTPTPTPTPEPVLLENLDNIEAGSVLKDENIDFSSLDKYFRSYEISDELFSRIYGDDRSYKTYCDIPREDLRYIKLLHRGFDQKIHVGEIMVNKLIEQDIIEIFTELFKNKYEIEKMFLVDNYYADDLLSIDDNNSSAFNYRMTTGSDTVLSNHAFGFAIDINPINNPYIWYDAEGNVCWEDRDADLYLDRNAPDAAQRHMINYDDLCYKLFTEHGFSWGGDWYDPVDYQHFEKVVGY